MYPQIPVAVLEEYEGRWIVWDEDERCVVGAGESLEEAEDRVPAEYAVHLLRIHHVLPGNVDIAGLL